jgi:hypothetical protein
LLGAREHYVTASEIAEVNTEPVRWRVPGSPEVSRLRVVSHDGDASVFTVVDAPQVAEYAAAILKGDPVSCAET